MQGVRFKMILIEVHSFKRDLVLRRCRGIVYDALSLGRDGRVVKILVHREGGIGRTPTRCDRTMTLHVERNVGRKEVFLYWYMVTIDDVVQIRDRPITFGVASACLDYVTLKRGHLLQRQEGCVPDEMVVEGGRLHR